MPSLPNETMPEERHILALDGLRGAAILLVLLFHTLARPSTATDGLISRALLGIPQFGWTGVDLFFVLSGFLITRILLDARTASNYFRVFFARRILRIFPIYYLTVILVFWIFPLLQHHFAFFSRHPVVHVGAKEQLWYWFNLVNLRTAFYPLLIPIVTHFWTLSIEEQFYAVWPAIVRFCSPRRLSLVCWTGIVTAFCLRQLPIVQSINATHNNFLYRFTPFRVDTLLFGALLAIFFHQRALTAAQTRRLFRISCLVFLLTLSLVVWRASPDPASGRYSYTLFAVLYSSLLTACLTGTIVARAFRFAPLRLLGKYSYCIYLIHPLVFYASAIVLPHILGPRLFRPGHGNGSHVILVALQILFCLGFAKLSWVLVEQPILRLKKYFRYTATPGSEAHLHTQNAAIHTR